MPHTICSVAIRGECGMLLFGVKIYWIDMQQIRSETLYDRTSAQLEGLFLSNSHAEIANIQLENHPNLGIATEEMMQGIASHFPGNEFPEALQPGRPLLFTAPYKEGVAAVQMTDAEHDIDGSSFIYKVTLPNGAYYEFFVELKDPQDIQKVTSITPLQILHLPRLGVTNVLMNGQVYADDIKPQLTPLLMFFDQAPSRLQDGRFVMRDPIKDFIGIFEPHKEAIIKLLPKNLYAAYTNAFTNNDIPGIAECLRRAAIYPKVISFIMKTVNERNLLVAKTELGA